MPNPLKKGKLILKDGTVFEGELFGSQTSISGEVVFSTGMVGYPESLTDPSFHGQILTLTFPLIGNYGVPNEHLNKEKFSDIFESEKVHIRGLVVSEYSDNYSHWHAGKSLSDFLKEAGVPGISGIDTRRLTKILREKGSQVGKIVADGDNPKNIEIYDPGKINMIPEVSPKTVTKYNAPNGKKTIVVIDCGVKNNTIRSFLKRGVNIIRVPWDYDFMDAAEMKGKFDAVFISNGPGDPALLTPTVNIIKKVLAAKIPTFGICLGNQLIGIAAGGKTYKLKYGHRAQNQPCVNTESLNCAMTSQNHGYAIDRKSLPKDWKVWFEHANDQTVEGIKHVKLPFMAVQFHPEACPGPVDSDGLFDQFLALI